jgi:hypothetical protein
MVEEARNGPREDAAKGVGLGPERGARHDGSPEVRSEQGES